MVEVVGHCHTQYGKLNRLGSAVDMMRMQKGDAVTVEKASKLAPEALEGKVIIGVLMDKELPVYQEQYEKVRARAKGTVLVEDQ